MTRLKRKNIIMGEKLVKLTIIGDIACDRPLLEASKIWGGGYTFTNIFLQTKHLFDLSDYVIANFETVCAGSNDDYKNEFFLYNCPDEIIPAMKEGGIDFVTTANNHCLDQGIAGLKRTIEVLDKNGVAHTGTFANLNDRDIGSNLITVGGIKVAILAYTTGTNESNTGIALDDANDFHVGLLRKQVDHAKLNGGMKGILARHLSAKQRRTLQRVINRTKLRMGIAYFKPYTDQLSKEDTLENPYLIKVKQEISEVKKVADIVVVCPHMGGQFNTEPGTYSKFMVDFLKDCGADIIAGNHPHVVQKAMIADECVVAYSIGGFNLSISADYIVHESLPEYSMALHVYIDVDSKRIDHATFSILKIIEDEKKRITVYPIHELPNDFLDEKTRKEITEIFNRITGKSVSTADICAEYDL